MSAAGIAGLVALVSYLITALCLLKMEPKQPKTRSWTAISAFMRSGAGRHGGTARAKNRRDRKRARQEAREQR